MRARKLRRKLQDTRTFLKETEGMLKRAKSLDAAPRKAIEQAQENLRTAIKAEDARVVEQSAKQLDELAHKHLWQYKKSSLRENVESVTFAVLVALTLRAFVVEAFKIPSGSMIPTLEIGDQIFVNKYIYGLRVPLTMIKFAQWNEPKRGEVIVFMYPQDTSRDYIKRVVGLPGDTVEVRDGQLFINDQPVARTEQKNTCNYWDRPQDMWQQQTCKAYAEQLGEHSHLAIFATDEGRSRNVKPIKVEPEHVFVMGDNRDNSSDSRVWGQVPYENIRGRAMFIWWAWSHDGPTLARFFKWIE
jgi:signal peptidase I